MVGPGYRTIIGFVDQVARDDPYRVFASYPRSTRLEDGLQDITYQELSRAIDATAWWVEELLGKGIGFPTLAWIGPFDLRYIILPLAANKAGYRTLLLSPRNSLEHHLHLLKASACQTVIRDKNDSHLNSVLKARPDLKSIKALDLSQILAARSWSYPWTEVSALTRPFLVMQSSGSTGLPKCIPWSHKPLVALDAQHDLPARDGSTALLPSFEPGNFLLLFPLFHAAGILFSMSLIPFYGHKLVLPSPGQVRAETLIEALEHFKIDTLAAPPSVLEDLSLMPESALLSSVSQVLYGGGPLSTVKGRYLSKYTKLWNIVGSTECGKFPLKIHDEKDFNYVQFPTDLKGIEFRKHSEEDNLHELYWVRDDETDRFHATWSAYANLDEYGTKDLYAPHPEIAGLWKHCGRVDDVLVLSNGEKLVATALEKVLNGCSLIKDVLVLGHGRFEVAALVELTEQGSTIDSDHLFSEFMPYVTEGNRSMPRHAALSKDRILFTKAEKPMVRAGKGSVIRSHTLSLYSQEIEQLYSSAHHTGSGVPALNTITKKELAKVLTEIYSNILCTGGTLNPDEDVFAQGLDSLGVFKTMRQIQAILGEKNNSLASSINTGFIYSNPTIDQLADALIVLASEISEDPNGSQPQIRSEDQRLVSMQGMLNKYSQDLQAQPESQIEVLLTGSTGFLGSYLLDSLVANPSIAHIYVLNRATDGGLAQHRALKTSSSLPPTFHKVTFIHAELSKPLLGLKRKVYNLLQDSVHTIIHNQWQVDFNLPLSTFEPHIAGVRHLIDMATTSSLNPNILFTSSVSTILNYSTIHALPPSGLVPEILPADPKVAMPSGYGMSKYISEQLLDRAAKSSGVRASIARMGQIAGPAQTDATGMKWKRCEWLPSMLLSSASLKRVPGDLGEIDWIPVDLLADGLVEIALTEEGKRCWSAGSGVGMGNCDNGSEQGGGVRVYNVSNPQVADWKMEILPTVMEFMPRGTRVVTMREWVGCLRESRTRGTNGEIDDGEILEANPALKLLDFFEAVASKDKVEMGVRMEVEKARKVSRTIANLEPVKSEWMQNWMVGWNLQRRKKIDECFMS